MARSATAVRFTEQTPYAPSSPYSASKAASDHLVQAWHHTYGLPTLTTNCSNNYGPYQYPEKLIPLMILNALAGKPLPIYGTGGNVRDWLFVEDHCRAIWHVVNHGLPGEMYNVGGNSEKTNLQVVDLCSLLDELLPDSPAAAAYGTQDVRRRPPGTRLALCHRCRQTARPARLAAAGELRVRHAPHRAVVPRPPRLVRGGQGRNL